MGTGSTTAAPLEPEGKSTVSKINNAMPPGESLKSEAMLAAVSALVMVEPSLNKARASLEASALSGGEPKPAIAPLRSLFDPFAGFVGHFFLHFCRLVEVIDGWTKPATTPAELAAESLLQSSAHPWLKHWGACSLGTIYCTMAAAGVIPMFYATSIKSLLPFPFLIIIGMVAFRFGRAAGILGTSAAALLFAAFLYEPSPSLAISDPVSRNHLIWMVAIGVVISDLLARFRARRMGAQRF